MPPDAKALEKEQLAQWMSAPLEDLVRHIVERYHLEGRLEIARLEAQAEEAVLLGDRHNPALIQIRNEVCRFANEMRSHLQLEEREIFPVILELAYGMPPTQLAGPLSAIKQMMEKEHEAEASILRGIRSLAAACATGSGASALPEAFHTTLRGITTSLQRHFFLETQILMKRLA